MRSICHSRQGVRFNQYCMYCRALVLFHWLCTWTGNNACSRKSYGIRSLLSLLSVLAFLLHKHVDFPFPWCSLYCMAVNKCQKQAQFKNKHRFFFPPVIENSSTIPSGDHVCDQTLFKTQNSPISLLFVWPFLAGLGRSSTWGPSVCAGWFHGERQGLALSLFGDHPGLSRWEINKRLGPSQGMQNPSPSEEIRKEGSVWWTEGNGKSNLAASGNWWLNEANAESRCMHRLKQSVLFEFALTHDQCNYVHKAVTHITI